MKRRATPATIEAPDVDNPTASDDGLDAGAPVDWHDGNARHLSAGVRWLRLRLAASATPDALSRAAQDFEQAALRMDRPPALVGLGQRLGLSTFESRLLLLCVAMELDTRVAALCATAQADPGRPWPTFALAMALFEDARWDAMAPDAPLRRWKLIDIQQGPTQPLTTSPLRADERIVHYVKGLSLLDERLMALMSSLPSLLSSPSLPGSGNGLDRSATALQPSQQAGVDRIVAAWSTVPAGARCPVVQLLGSDAGAKRRTAAAAADRLGRRVFEMPAESLPVAALELDTLARLWERETLLDPVALYLACGDDAASAPQQASVLSRFLARCDGIVFVDSRDRHGSVGGRPGVAIDVALPTAAEQRATWQMVLADRAGDRPAALAAQFNLDTDAIARIGAEVLVTTPAGLPAVDPSLADRLWDACREAVRPGLDALAQRIDSKATWADLVLPTAQQALLRRICAQVRRRGRVYDEWGFAARMNRGLGISALFEGASGVGKTMAAEVIANDLRLNLYRIDLSTVISKYIGETEGNLRRLFDAADDGGAILFFDECDALFGKRSEVKDSHDRFANIETNYLLQRIESYRGLAILATNMKSALDSAFIRRLRFIVNFPFPGPVERTAIWRRAFPAGVPCRELDLDRIGRLNLTGGSIHSAALAAAFAAAEANGSVDSDSVLQAIRSEFMKLGRPVNEAEFRL